MNPAFRANGWLPRRRFWVAVYRYFGLATAIFIAVAALTEEQDSAAREPREQVVSPVQRSGSIERGSSGAGYTLNVQSCSLAMNPVSRNRPMTMIMAAAPTSMPFKTSVPLPGRASVIRPARSRAQTASVAIAAIVIAVPAPIIRAEPIPVQNMS